jgi:hypothetical protein
MCLMILQIIYLQNKKKELVNKTSKIHGSSAHKR